MGNHTFSKSIRNNFQQDFIKHNDNRLQRKRMLNCDTVSYLLSKPPWFDCIHRLNPTVVFICILIFTLTSPDILLLACVSARRTSFQRPKRDTVTAPSPHQRKTTATKFLSELSAERGNWDRRILISPMNFYVNGKQYSFISSSPKYRTLHLEPAPGTLALHSMCNGTLGSTCNSRERFWDALDKRVLLLSPLAVHWWKPGLPGWLLQVDNLASEAFNTWFRQSALFKSTWFSLAHWKENFTGYNARFGGLMFLQLNPQKNYLEECQRY